MPLNKILTKGKVTPSIEQWRTKHPQQAHQLPLRNRTMESTPWQGLVGQEFDMKSKLLSNAGPVPVQTLSKH